MSEIQGMVIRGRSIARDAGVGWARERQVGQWFLNVALVGATGLNGGCTDTEPPSGSGGACLGGTGGWSMTTGEDHGAPWVPPAMPDIGSQLLDVGPGCETDCPGGGGILEWEQDPLTDIWYRGVTEDEMEANDWPPGTLLMIVPSSTFSAANSEVVPPRL